jgi:Cdc6-like AAA superfamily ATPase
MTEKYDFSKLSRGTNTLLVGATGTGKTHALRTMVECGLEVFAVFTEPSMEMFDDIPKDKLHWHYIESANPAWDDMVDSAKKINQLSFQGLTQLSDVNKKGYGQFIEVLNTLANFVDDRTGEEFGAVDNFGPERALYFDGLSGLCIMAMDLVVGSKPVKNQGDWGVAMDNLERLINKLCFSTRCWFVMTSHVERQLDEIVGATTIQVSVLGKKLAPKIPRYFSDVVLTVRDGNEFTWTTTEYNADLKARNLPLGKDLQPNFELIVKAVFDRLEKTVE